MQINIFDEAELEESNLDRLNNPLSLGDNYLSAIFLFTDSDYLTQQNKEIRGGMGQSALVEIILKHGFLSLEFRFYFIHQWEVVVNFILHRLFSCGVSTGYLELSTCLLKLKTNVYFSHTSHFPVFDKYEIDEYRDLGEIIGKKVNTDKYFWKQKKGIKKEL